MDIVLTQVKHAPILSDYYLRNAERFTPWHPQVRPGHHSVTAWRQRLQDRERDYQEGRAAHFIGMAGDKVIAACSLTNIVYHPACYCQLGYSVDRDYEGSGTMSALVRHVIDFGFKTLRLNRICANYMPANTRSAKLLESFGFEKEGYARRFLFINNRWEDHILTSLLNPDGADLQGDLNAW